MKKLVETLEQDCLAEQNTTFARAYTPVIRAQIVPNSEALSFENPERIEWIASLDKEVSGLLGRGVVAFRRPDELQPGDEILPSVVVFTKRRQDPKTLCTIQNEMKYESYETFLK